MKLILEMYKDCRKVAEMDVTELSFDQLDKILEIQCILDRIFRIIVLEKED